MGDNNDNDTLTANETDFTDWCFAVAVAHTQVLRCTSKNDALCVLCRATSGLQLVWLALKAALRRFQATLYRTDLPLANHPRPAATLPQKRRFTSTANRIPPL